MKRKRTKKRDHTRHLRNAAPIADRYIVWSVEGQSAGVKLLQTGEECKISRDVSYILMNNRARFSICIGAMGRTRDGYLYSEEILIVTEATTGACLTPTIRQLANEQAHKIPRGELLTTYYFATSETGYGFPAHMVWSWLTEAGLLDNLQTWEEYATDKFKQQGAAMAKLEMNNHQIGGNHYSKYTIQPRHVITQLRLPWDFANAIKYVIRYKDKNGSEDLKKAWDYIARTRADGMVLFTASQHRIYKRDDVLYREFTQQFDLRIREILADIWNVFKEKPQTQEDFYANLDALLFNINELHRAEYGSDVY